MGAPKYVEKAFLGLANHLYAGWPQPRPAPERLRNCKIVSHRGQHDNGRILENTFAAFDEATKAGVWGIECDVRWTRDLHPVVFHDSDCCRLFGIPLKIADLTRKQLNDQFPSIPSLESFIKRYGQNQHLMVELKSDPYPRPERQRDILSQLFETLSPVRDFHILSLDPGLFAVVDFAPSQALLPVSMANPHRISETTIRNGYGGLAGHFAFLRGRILSRHHAQGQRVGTGFISSRNCLYREINRDIEWIFSNHAVELQQICDGA